MLRPDLVDRAPVEVRYAIRQMFPAADVVAVRVEGQGMDITSSTLTDQQMNTALDAWTFTSSWDREESWEDPLPREVTDHIQHMRDYLDADPAVITTAQSVHAIKDIIRAIRCMNRRLL